MIRTELIKNSLIIFIIAFNTLLVQGQTNYKFYLGLYATDFQKNILDENATYSIESSLTVLKEEIETELLNHNEFSNYSINELHYFKEQATALSAFIGAVNPFTGNMFMKFDDLLIVDEYINFDIEFVSTDKYCVDLIKILIGDYISYYSYNKTDILYTIYFKSRYTDRQGGGIEVTQGLPKKSIRKLSDNHESIGIDRKFTFKLMCKKI